MNDYIEFLKSKYSEAKTERNWADNLTDSQKQSINKGIDDIKNEKTYSHEEAKEKLNNIF